MPIGVLINSSAVIIGGCLGATFQSFLKKELCEKLTLIFGVCSMAMGINSIIQMKQMPAVMFAVIFGLVIGEVMQLESMVVKGTMTIQKPLETVFKNQDTNQELFLSEFISIVVLFCASGTGIFGSLQSGITGDHTILISKSVLDLFTAAIFAASLGYMVSIIAVPQFVIMILLFLSAKYIMPFVTPTMLSDFTACGGVLMLATGFRIAGIAKFPTANMIPAMLLVMPFSALWSMIF